MSTQRLPFPNVVDSTYMSDYNACSVKFLYSRLHHLHTEHISIDLIAGAAYAAGHEAFRKSYWGTKPGDFGAALVALYVGFTRNWMSDGNTWMAEDEQKSFYNTILSCVDYYSTFVPSCEPYPPYILPNGLPAVEVNFCEPLEDAPPHPETGDPILFAGRMDQIVQGKAGICYNADDKTTKALGTQWTKQWDMRGQFSAYAWGTQRLGFQTEGMLVRGCGIMKTKSNYAEVLTQRPKWMVDRWYHQTCRNVEKMIEHWRTGRWDYNLGESCTHYGGCTYQPLCLHPNPEKIRSLFTRRVWSPIAAEAASVERKLAAAAQQREQHGLTLEDFA